MQDSQRLTFNDDVSSTCDNQRVDLCVVDEIVDNLQ